MATHSPLTRRRSGLDTRHVAAHARHATTRARLVRRGFAIVAATGAVLLLAAVLAVTFVGISGANHRNGPGTSASAHSPRRAAPSRSSPPPPAPAVVTTAEEPWQLQAAVGAEAVLPVTGPLVAGSAGRLEVFGGSTTGGQPAQGVYTLDLSTGALAHVGNLQVPLDDAAGAVVGGEDMVLGGDGPAPLSTVQGLGAPGTTTTPSVVRSTVVGSLPEPRSGAAAVTIGTTTYVVGGGDATTPQPEVLATTDGRSFAVAATLRVAVAYPAVVAVGREIYVFGGSALTGTGTGQPVTTIQVIDPTTHSVTVAGRLPEPLAGATAVTIAGRVFVIGGDVASSARTSSSGPTTSVPGTAGTTSATVWTFDPPTAAMGVAGHLRVPVSHAGVAVVGQQAWIVGGETAGVPTAVVQTVSYESPG